MTRRGAAGGPPIFQIEPTRHDENDVGLERAQLRPFHPIRRPASRSRDEIAAGERDQLGHPMARHVGGIEPFQREDTRSMPITDTLADHVDARLHARDECVRP